MPEQKGKKVKKKESKSVSVDHHLKHIYNEINDLKEKLDKVRLRMGL